VRNDKTKKNTTYGRPTRLEVQVDLLQNFGTPELSNLLYNRASGVTVHHPDR